MSGAIQDGRVCLRVETNRGLVKRTRCDKWSTTTRTTLWASEVTCAECLTEMAAGKANVAEQNMVGKFLNDNGG